MTGIDYTKRSIAAPPANTAISTDGVGAARVSLTKASPGISLTKQIGRLRVNLNWDARPAAPARGGMFARLAPPPRGIDLDLGCLYELTDGSKGVVQALGNSFGNLQQAPFIWLNGDDRSGDNTAGEDLFVNLTHAAEIRRILVFACVYEGASSFEQANAVVTLTPAVGPEVEVRLDGQGGRSRMCAVALLTGGPGGLTANREIRYVEGSQRALDEAYDWGLNWAAGRK